MCEYDEIPPMMSFKDPKSMAEMIDVMVKSRPIIVTDDIIIMSAMMGHVDVSKWCRSRIMRLFEECPDVKQMMIQPNISTGRFLSVEEYREVINVKEGEKVSAHMIAGLIDRPMSELDRLIEFVPKSFVMQANKAVIRLGGQTIIEYC